MPTELGQEPAPSRWFIKHAFQEQLRREQEQYEEMTND